MNRRSLIPPYCSKMGTEREYTEFCIMLRRITLVEDGWAAALRLAEIYKEQAKFATVYVSYSRSLMSCFSWSRIPFKDNLKWCDIYHRDQDLMNDFDHLYQESFVSRYAPPISISDEDNDLEYDPDDEVCDDRY